MKGVLLAPTEGQLFSLQHVVPPLNCSKTELQHFQSAIVTSSVTLQIKKSPENVLLHPRNYAYLKKCYVKKIAKFYLF